jgi:hypothetical protein
MRTDAEFARAFEAGAIDNRDFHHVDHLRLGWAYLQESASVAEAADRMCETLRSFAAAAGHPEKFSEPLTVFWIQQLATAAAGMKAETFDAVLRSAPYLLDKDLKSR